MQVETKPKVDHTPAELDDTSKLLLKAAAAIEESGHRQYDLGAPSRGFCVLGGMAYIEYGSAISIAQGKDWTPAMSRAMSRLSCSVGGCAVAWNNAEERTKDEVVAKLRAVALGG